MPPELYEQTYQNRKHFSFGKNWQKFLQSMNDARVTEAEASLSNFLGGKENITGKTFADIGCGSGLFSLSAYRLGAQRVVSVDIDDFSLACVKGLHEKENSPAHWEIQKGSALDEAFLRSLGEFDIVYSWGVLHHTGNMYQALRNVLLLAGPHSSLYIALYNKNTHFLEGTSPFWVKAKKVYNQSSSLEKKILEIFYIGYYLIGLVVHGISPITYIRNYQSLRGMDFLTDIRDWLGGHPYEFADTETITRYFDQHGFTCKKTNPARSLGCNEFLFVKKEGVR